MVRQASHAAPPTRGPCYTACVVSSAPEVGVRYTVPQVRTGWELSEESMPESTVHDEAVDFLKLLLLAWAARVGNARVARNLAVRWDASHPKNGVDPDVCVLSPPPPGSPDLTSLLTWQAGHAPPLLAIEVVSENNPRKDYVVAPDKYAASGTRELWIFDPLLAGPASQGGPHRLQVWSRTEGELVRVYAGPGPVWSPALGACLVPIEGGRKLRIAEDLEGTKVWMTAEEAALARVAELEAELARRVR